MNSSSSFPKKTFFVNIFALAVGFFVMVVYDRIIPNNAITSLTGLFFGASVVILLKYFLELLKTYFLDQVVATSSGAADCSLFNKALQLMPIEPACLVKVVFTITVFDQYRPHHHSYYVFQFDSFSTACFAWLQS